MKLSKFMEVMDLKLSKFMESMTENYSVYATMRNYAANAEDQEYLRTHGMNPAVEWRAFEAEIPLEITRFIENKLPPNRHYVIVHFKSSFCREVKRRRLKNFEDTGNQFSVAYNQCEYRIAYTEADRDLMDKVWGEEETQDYLNRLLLLRDPAKISKNNSRVVKRVACRRSGPYAWPLRGSSEHVSPPAIADFFGATSAEST